jgi:hypothetical protein
VQIKCENENCEATAEYSWNAGGTVNVSYPSYLFLCPLVNERATKGEILDPTEVDCPHMKKTVSAALSRRG